MTDVLLDPIRVLVIDDEELGRKKIVRMLKEDRDIEIIGESAGGPEALPMISEMKPDLLFLDIQMPGMDGFDLLRQASATYTPFVIFVTAYDQHALRAFQVHALDYLMKPFDRERFQEALQRAKAQVRQKRNGEISRKILAMLDEPKTGQPHAGRERFMVKAGGRISFLRADEIDWIEAQGDYVRLNSAGKRYLLREKIGDLEDQLSPDKFLRIHRSTIVNIERIKEMQALYYGEYAVILQDGTRLTLSRSFRERVFNLLTKAS